ncbi:hypothetical protein [uncultured Actinomyces sp.]|uniref:hypothetical protein n=1 Tax=uncultured Actinomyces sp. TaxID=249061 RepID=UPI00262D7C3F|nr:hypothetical protein [uncultured Actinomyces sp.]
MSVNDFDQTVPLPTNGEETTPLPVGNDAPEVPQPASASDETATLPSGLVPETRELPVTEDAAPSSAKQAEADAGSSGAPAVPPSESAPHASSGTSSTYTSPQAGASASSAWATSAGQTQAPHSVPDPDVIPPTRVWSAEELKEAPYRGVRIGQLVWACIVIFTGVVLIALAFARMMDFALIAIATLAVLGVLLMTIAGVSSLSSRKKRSDR